jgi:hypothetical protein
MLGEVDCFACDVWFCSVLLLLALLVVSLMFDCEKEEDVLRHMIGDKKRDRDDDDGGKLLDV